MARLRKPFPGKQVLKHAEGSCHLCKNTNYNVLSVHRIVWGGDYSLTNTVSICENCHRKVHANEIVIDRWYNSTSGRVLHWFDENKIEHFD